MLLLFFVTAVPSANKRDLRSIEETLQDLRSKKKARLDPEVEVAGGEEEREGEMQRTSS